MKTTDDISDDDLGWRSLFGRAQADQVKAVDDVISADLETLDQRGVAVNLDTEYRLLTG
jgi:hypothetical protein